MRVYGLAVAMIGCGIAAAQSTDALGRGVYAFCHGNFVAAAAHLQTAVAANPGSLIARQYLAGAQLRMVGTKTGVEENRSLAEMVLTVNKEILSREPSNTTAMWSVGAATLHLGRPEEAKAWFRRILAVNPTHSMARAALGYAIFTETSLVRIPVQAVGPRGDDPGPVRDATQRASLRAGILPKVDEGIQALEQVLAVDPDQAEALAYTWLLHLRKAELADTALQYRDTMVVAETWRDRAIAARGRARAARTRQPACNSAQPPPPAPLVPPVPDLPN